MTGGRSMTTGEPRQPPDGGQNIGWTIFGYLISGMFVYGGLGWVIGHWTGHPLIFPLGFGLVIVLRALLQLVSIACSDLVPLN